jgi:hypothetical protein
MPPKASNVSCFHPAQGFLHKPLEVGLPCRRLGARILFREAQVIILWTAVPPRPCLLAVFNAPLMQVASLVAQVSRTAGVRAKVGWGHKGLPDAITTPGPRSPVLGPYCGK